MNSSERRNAVYRWRWPSAFAAVALTVGVIGWLGAGGPQIVVYPTTDFARLPVSAADPVPAAALLVRIAAEGQRLPAADGRTVWLAGQYVSRHRPGR
ncbi:hypothetical protein [Mycobacterium sp.]|uniref:hypothetical protein n=1 Tax=Mycobacterium sp. TaxID=1785 RepID=UPI003D0C61D2